MLRSVSRRLALLTMLASAAAWTAAASASASSPFPVAETFTGTAGTLGSQWQTGGNALLTAPSIDATGSGWLRLTSTGNNQFGYIINDTPFPSNNGIEVSFDYASYGGTGADGLAFFLYDGSTSRSSFATGPAGGSLGYASCNSTPGLTNAYVGVGFDEWGNFANSGFCGLSGFASGLQPNRVTVRGSATDSYRYLTSVATAESLIGSSRADSRRVTVSVTPDMKLSVYITYPDGSVQTVTSGYQLPTAPGNLKFGWVASTGGSTDVHEIRNSTVAEPADLQTTVVSAPSTADRSGNLTYTFKVTNVGQNPTTGSTVVASNPGGPLQNVSWTCASTTGTCGAAAGTGLPNTTADLPVGASATYTVTAQPTSSTNYAAVRLEADPTGVTTQSVPNDNVASATTELAPLTSAAPAISLANTNGYTGVATGSQGTYAGRNLTITDNWQHCSPDGTSCSDIPGATSLSYTTGSSDRGYTLRLHEHVSDVAGSIDSYSDAYAPLPDTSESTATPAVGNSTSAGFTLESDTSGVAYECKLDASSWAPCSSAPSYSGLSAGTHTFSARAVYGGLNDPVGTSYTWAVDTTAPTDTSSCPSPDGQHGWYASAPSCTVSATDASGVGQMQYYVDAGSVHSVSSGATVGVADGTHTLHTRAQDNAGNYSSWRSFSLEVDTLAPSDTSDCGTPNGQDGWFATGPTCSVNGSDTNSGIDHVAYQLDSDSVVTTASGTTTASLTISAEGTHTVKTEVFDAAGNHTGWTTHTIKLDTIAPGRPTVNTPRDGSRTSDSEPAITLTAEPGSTDTIYIDGAAVGTTTASGSGDASLTLSSPLADGPHTVYVTAADDAGNVSTRSDTNSFTVDTTAPGAPIVTSPAADSTSNDVSPTVTVTGEPDATVTLEIDGSDHGPVQLDSSGAGHLATPGPLSAGQHTVRARQTDQTGNLGPWSSSSSWTVKTQTTVHLSGPTAGPINVNTPTVDYQGEAGDEFEITVDGQAVATGVIPVAGTGSLTLPTPLPSGAHTVAIAVTDGPGNHASDSIVLTIDTISPGAVQISSAPAPLTQSRAAQFTLSDPKAGVSYQCSLDGATWAACPSTPTFPGLGDGPHTILVRAVDQAGNLSPSTEYSWTIKTTPPPAPTILGGPGSFTTPSPSRFEISPAPATTLECSVDGRAFSPCSQLVRLHSLPIGRHTLAVRVVDEAGNTSAPSTYTWSVLHRTGARGLPRRASLLVAPQATASGGRSVDVGCNLNAGSLKRCVVTVEYHHQRIGAGMVREVHRGHMRSIVTVKLTSRGRRLLARAVDGLPVEFVGPVKPFGFTELAARRTHTVLYEPLRFVLSDVLFDFDSSMLTSSAGAIVRDIAHGLHGAQTVVCEGNTDSYGSRSYNYWLGLRRAQTVCAQLRQFGVDARVTSVSNGAERPVASNATVAGRRLNRRVVVRASYYDLPAKHSRG
ncbi:MAG TPA: Ig-like domain-containing protein [Solirubrobacteraceae bacterium]